MRTLTLLPCLAALLAACATPPPPPATGIFTLEPGQSLRLAPDLVVQLDRVEDSRCPAGVLCIWAGKLGYDFSIRRAGGAPDSVELTPFAPSASPPLLGGRQIVLDTAALPTPGLPGIQATHRTTFAIRAPSSSQP